MACSVDIIVQYQLGGVCAVFFAKPLYVNWNILNCYPINSTLYRLLLPHFKIKQFDKVEPKHQKISVFLLAKVDHWAQIVIQKKI